MDERQADMLLKYWEALRMQVDFRSQSFVETIGDAQTRTSSKGESFHVSVFRLPPWSADAHAFTITANSRSRVGQYRFQVRATKTDFSDSAADSLALGRALDTAMALLATAGGTRLGIARVSGRMVRVLIRAAANSWTKHVDI